jgi:hypothetical protein
MIIVGSRFSAGKPESAEGLRVSTINPVVSQLTSGIDGGWSKTPEIQGI